MKNIEKRLRAIEAVAGRGWDDSFGAAATRAHARGESIPQIIVEPGESAVEVARRAGIAEGMPYIACMIVDAKPALAVVAEVDGDMNGVSHDITTA